MSRSAFNQRLREGRGEHFQPAATAAARRGERGDAQKDPRWGGGVAWRGVGVYIYKDRYHLSHSHQYYLPVKVRK
uniref:Uncharacterized protein n=1 Tax=uncultured marine virus TaxID=186617 RepID=A0A0F7L1S4_9VIRU|nr:hypothetical protein [uncultured marine virus]